MDGFDTLTMSYLAGPMSLQSVTGPDQQQHAGPLLPLDHVDHRDHRSNYDADAFAG